MLRLDTEALLARLAEQWSATVDPALHGQVADEQLRRIWSHARLGSVVASVFAVVLALHLRGEALPASVVDAWLAVKLLVAAARIAQGRWYERQEAPDTRRWWRATLAMLALDGAVWGVAGYALMAGEIPIASLIGAVLACVACVATFGLQISLGATAAYVLPMLAPTALGLLMRGDDFGAIGGVGLLLLLGLQLATARRSQLRMVESMLLRLHAQALAQQKADALELALRQSAVKTQFLANVSHELRTPLHGILGVARLIHLEAHDAAVARRVELIEASGTHLLSLINDMLDLSRIESGKVAMRCESFDLVEQVRNVADVYAVRAQDKGLTFSLAIQFEPPRRVLGDPARFRQVLHNLLGNAMKFTEHGSVSLQVTRGDTPEMVCVQVRDSGVGIAEAELAHIFEAFRQSSQAASKPQDGVGLGLTIARELARAMDGDITVTSRLGAGSTMVFTARLPAAPAEPPAPGPASRAEAPPVQRGHHVLIAEDDDVNALIAGAYVEHFGYSVERVRDGKEAVRHALRETGRPDLVLMDCRMPVMDGYAATREIRAQERTLGLTRVPVIALTATSTELDRQQCREAGMDDFLSKPFTSEALAQIISTWIQPRPTADDRRS